VRKTTGQPQVVHLAVPGWSVLAPTVTVLRIMPARIGGSGRRRLRWTAAAAASALRHAAR
jgi:hypothetical protein